MGYISKEARDALQQFDSFLSSDRIFQARKELDELKRLAGNEEPGLKEELDQRKEDIVRCEKNAKLARDLIHDFESNEGWKESKKSFEGSKIYTRKQKNSNILTVKAETLIETKPEDLAARFCQLISLFNETDLMPDFFPRNFMESHELLRQLSRFSKVSFVKLNFGKWAPLQKRETILKAQGFDLSDEQSGLIFYESDNEEDFSVDSKAVRFYLRGAILFELAPGGILFKQIHHVDLKFKLIPKFLVNFISKGMFPFEFAEGIKSALTHYKGSKWEERMSEQPDFYGYLRTRILEFQELLNQV